jgi:hypothetical protein
MPYFQSALSQLALATAHGGLTLYMFIGAFTSDKGVVHVTLPSPQVISDSPDSMPVLDFTSNTIVGSMNLWVLNGIFSLWTCSFHLMYAYDRYTASGKEWKTLSMRMRWVEYLSASIMLLIIMALTGIRDVYLLMALSAMMWVVMDYGYQEERAFEMGDIQWPSPGMKGGFPFIVIWAIIISEFMRATTITESPPPTFVYLIVWVLLFMFSVFWFNQLYHLSWGPPPRPGSEAMKQTFVHMDDVFHLLSLTTKTALVLFVGFGLQGIIQ